MPKYSYIAKSLTTGETKSGIMEAKDEHLLAEMLRKEGLILIRTTLKKPKKDFLAPFLFRKVPLSEKMFFTRNLQVMISAGVSLPKAILNLAQQTKNPSFKKILEKINQALVKGEKFSNSLANFPDVFNEFYQQMVKVAEETGNLEEILKILAEQMEKENEIRSRIIGALIYPAVIILAMIGIGILMLIVVVPKLAEAFRELGAELPLTTKIVIGLGDFLSQKWPFLLSFLFFIVFLFPKIFKIKSIKKFFDKIFLKIPIVSGFLQKGNSATFARNLSYLISGGVPLPSALEITANTLESPLYKEALFSTVEKVRKGEKLSETLKNFQEIFSLTLIQMIEVGEETGETSSVLLKLAQFYEEELFNATKQLTSVIEPLIMFLIGGIVGFFAISMIQPIYSMLQAIK